jgi:hypothetical protein
LIGCNNIGEGIGGAAIEDFCLLEDNFDACISGRIVAFAVGYVLTIIPMLKKMPLRQVTRVTLVGDTTSISAMEIITENSLVFLIPGYSCTQD